MQADVDNLVEVKTCTKCGETKPNAEFYLDTRRGGYRPRCKNCSSEDAATYRAKNASAHKAYNDKWYSENKARRNKKAREWQKQNPEMVKSYQEKWLDNNADRARQQHRKADSKKRSTPKGRLENNIKAGVHRGLTKGSKNGRRTFSLLGYTIEDLRQHLEKQFAPGMTWENYGQWHVDHIIPLAAHNYETPDHVDFSRAWALKNLRPMWAKDNVSKGKKLTKSFQPSLLIATNDNRNSPQREVV